MLIVDVKQDCAGNDVGLRGIDWSNYERVLNYAPAKKHQQ